MGTTAKAFSVEFGKVVRKARLQKGISQEELGFRCNFDRTYVSRVELGKVNLSLQTAWLLAVGLDMPLEHLIGEAEQFKNSDSAL